MTSKILTNCRNCVKDLHDECQNENCLCRGNNHGKKERDLTDSIKEFTDVLVSTAPLRKKTAEERIVNHGRQIEQIENYLNSIIKLDPRLVKLLVREYFSSYTNSPINTAILAPSSEGKTFATVEVSKIFPEKDIIRIGRLSPTALIHQEGFYIDEDGNNIEEEVDSLDENILNSKGKEKAKLKKELHDLMRRARICVDLTHKSLLFLDNPSSATFEVLKPIMSHDVKEITYMTTGDKLKVKKSVIRGWAAFIFCSANNEEEHDVWQEIKTRVVVTAPNSDVAKYTAANKATALKLSRPSWAADPDAAEAEKWARFYVKELKSRLVELCKGDNNPIVNVFDAPLANLFSSKEGIDMRHFRRLMDFIHLETLINSEYNPELIFEDKDGRIVKSIFTTVEDIDAACDVLGGISTIDAEKIKFYVNVFKPLVAEVIDGEITTAKLAARYTLIFDKPTTPKRILENYCKPLADAGILSVEKNPKNESQNLYFDSSDVTIHTLDKLKSNLIETSIHDFSFMDSCLVELEKVSKGIRNSPISYRYEGKEIDLVTLKEILLGNSRNQSKPLGDGH